MFKEFLNPQEILEKLDLKESMAAVDFGCGSGGWAIPLAKILNKGRVYAIDVLEEPLSALRGRAKMEGLVNIITQRADVEKGTKLPNFSVDLVLMTNLLFQVDDKKPVFEEAKRVLKPSGRLLVVDWKKTGPFGPKDKVSAEEVRKIAEECGFKMEEEFNTGKYHFALIFVKI